MLMVGISTPEDVSGPNRPFKREDCPSCPRGHFNSHFIAQPRAYSTPR